MVGPAEYVICHIQHFLLCPGRSDAAHPLQCQHEDVFLIPWDSVTGWKGFSEAFANNAYWFTEQLITRHGAAWVLLILCLFMIGMTALKTACYFGSAA